MSRDLLYDLVDVETAVRDAARADLPEAITEVLAGTLPPKAAAPYVLFTVRAPRMSGPMMGGDQQADVTLSVTCTGRNRVQAVRNGGAVREFLLGRNRHGGFVVPIPLTGRAIIARRSNNDGAPDSVGGLDQWTETFTLTVARA